MTVPSTLARAVAPALLLALAYLAAGLLAAGLAIPPSYAIPIYPPAGIALAVVLVYGPRALPGVWLGAMAVNLALASARGSVSLGAIGVPIVIGLGATVQAALGAWLVRRPQSGTIELGAPRDIGRFFLLAGLLACVVNAAVATTALTLAGVVTPGERLFTAWTWWAGDTLGVLIAAPITLTLIGRPREDWRARRATVGLPLLGTTLLLALATQLVARWDTQRTQAAFERSAAASADAMAAQLREPTQALEAMRSLFLGSEDVSQIELARASEVWLQSIPGLQALGYSVSLPRDAIEAFEQRARAEGLGEFRVFDRPDVDRPALAKDRDVVTLRMIAPLPGNTAALGVNALSIPAAREAIERAARTNQAAATAAFRLTQDPEGREGIVVYRAIYRGDTAPAEPQRRGALAGVVFVTLRIDEFARHHMGRAPPYLNWCLSDVTAPQRRRLAGAPGCEWLVGHGLQHARSLVVGGRNWELRLAASANALPYASHLNAWLFSIVGLMSAAVLGALLLTVTGRARRVEQLVAARTADLQHEIGERQRTQEALQEAMKVRERTQAELRESQRQLRTIVDHVPLGVRYTDMRRRLLEVNPAFCQLTGYSAAELIGMDVARLHHPDDRDKVVRAFDAVVRGEPQQAPVEFRYMTRSGQPRWVRLSMRLVGKPGDELARTVGVVEDITEHLQLREAEQARQAAEAASRAKSDFVSRMSHELRTPLNAMLGFAQLLELDQRPTLAPHQTEWTAQIQHAGWHLLHMINDTLDLSRIESGTLRLETTAVDLPALVRACVSMIEPAAARRAIRLEQELDPACRLVLGDATRCKQVLLNLLSNAVKYNVDGGSVRIRSRRAEDGVRITVADSGLGMSQDQLAQLFQPFNRLGRERGATEGTGIGLVIARRLAELMGGRLDAESQPGQGSTFTLMLPAPEAPVDTGLQERTDPGPTVPQYHQRLVHYIEDNETNAEVMRGILAQRPQVRLAVSARGLEGLAAVRRQPPSLILLDLNLPDITGLDLLTRLRADPDLANVPVIVVSADATTPTIERAFAMGATDYVTKPINVPGFLAALDRSLESQDTAFGGFQ
jgi:PAS domain S-box-containing protein